MEKRELPNGTAVLVLGILSILTCCCYGIVGIVLGIIALVLAKKDMVLYADNPDIYSNYSNINTGRILAIIGIVLSSISLIINIYFYSVVGTDGMKKFQEEWIKEIQKNQH